MTEHRDERAMDATDNELDVDRDGAFENDRPGELAGVDDDQGGTDARPAGPDSGASPLDDETPGSQGEIEAGSEGDFGGRGDPPL